jgi:hypothetical protein
MKATALRHDRQGGRKVSAAGRLRFLYLAYLSKPKALRPLYRLIRRRRPKKIIEIGIGETQRAGRMIAVAQRYAGDDVVHYTGIDLFESAGPARASLPLKEAYRRLRATRARIRLEPGDPHWALARAANSLAGTDLVLISAGLDEASMSAAWFYLPRMLHGDSVVLLEELSDRGPVLRKMSAVEIAQLARPTVQRRAA